MTLPFSVFSGAGNSFCFFDGRNIDFPVEEVSSICRQEGVDGVIVLENSGNTSDIKMRIFNPDHSEAEMCGNGLRCFVGFLSHLGLTKKKYSIETAGGNYLAWQEGKNVRIVWHPPSNFRWSLDDNLHFLNTGVPHAVVFVDELESVDVLAKGRFYRYHPYFSPSGANVNFVKVHSKNHISIRTYERGVERETLACGTGAVASALAAAKNFSLTSPIEVSVASKEKITIYFNESFDAIEMSGPISFIKDGEMRLGDAAGFSLNTKTPIISSI